jgi:hypothetical protein
MAKSAVTNDFKAAFALLLSILKINYGVDPALNYSELVCEWTLAGLMTEDKIKQEWTDDGYKLVDVEGYSYSKQFNYAHKKYQEAVGLIGNVQSGAVLKGYTQKEILGRCFEINQAIFPIALKEGLLDLKDIAVGIGAGAGVPSERDR